MYDQSVVYVTVTRFQYNAMFMTSLLQLPAETVHIFQQPPELESDQCKKSDTYSMEQRPSLEGNWSAASQEILTRVGVEFQPW
jgi:hypothetical protein